MQLENMPRSKLGTTQINPEARGVVMNDATAAHATKSGWAHYGNVGEFGDSAPFSILNMNLLQM